MKYVLYVQKMEFAIDMAKMLSSLSNLWLFTRKKVIPIISSIHHDMIQILDPALASVLSNINCLKLRQKDEPF